MPPQPFACSLKLLKRKGVEGRSEKKGRRRISQKREKNDAPEENGIRDNAGIHTQTWRVVDKHTDNKCQLTTQRWVFGPPEFSCLPVADSPYRMASTVHQTWDRERNFLSPRIGCLPARPLASALRRLLPFRGGFPPDSATSQRVRWPRPYASWSPLYRRFFSAQIPSCFPAGPRIYTGLSCSA